MTAIEALQSLSSDCLTERQARFLGTVMQHSGVCLPRQYAAFAGIVYGEKTWAFFNRLVRWGFAAEYRCRHARGRVYHVCYKPLYRAIGDTDSPFRRSMSAAQVIDRLATLDAMFATPHVTWLGSPEDRQARLGGAQPDVLRKLPIGIDRDGRVVLVFLVIKDRLDEFRMVLQQCGRFFSTMPAWTVRVVVESRLNWLSTNYDEVFRDEFARPVPDLVKRVRWYFEQRRAASANPASVQDEERYFEERFALGNPRYQVLYRRWLKEGEAAFDVVSSQALADAIAAGTGRLECALLPFSYRHLYLVIDRAHRPARGADGLEETHACPQPRDRWRERIAAIAEELAAESDSSTSEGVAP